MLGIFALSAALKETDLGKYQASLELFKPEPIELELALNLEYRKEIFASAEYFTAGDIKERLDSLYSLNASKLLALKGGYGAMQCLEELDKSFFKDKSIFAYSDLTALFLELEADRSIKLYHSPMFVELESLNTDEINSLKAFLYQTDTGLKELLLSSTKGLRECLKASKSIFLQNPCYVWGGNLTLLLAMNKKPVIDNSFKNILFIEDCFEEAYKVERMLYAAEKQALLEGLDELWLGESKEALFNEALIEALAKKYNFNLVKAVPFGHNKKFTLPIFQYFN